MLAPWQDSASDCCDGCPATDGGIAHEICDLSIAQLSWMCFYGGYVASSDRGPQRAVVQVKRFHSVSFNIRQRQRLSALHHCNIGRLARYLHSFLWMQGIVVSDSARAGRSSQPDALSICAPVQLSPLARTIGAPTAAASTQSMRR